MPLGVAVTVAVALGVGVLTGGTLAVEVAVALRVGVPLGLAAGGCVGEKDGDAAAGGAVGVRGTP